MQLSSFSLSDIGQRDYLVDETRVLQELAGGSAYLVSDGCGDDQENKQFVRAFSDQLSSTLLQFQLMKKHEEMLLQVDKLIQTAVKNTHKVFPKTKSNQHGLVFSMAIVLPEIVIKAHVGDSRIYRIFNGKITRTTDHTMSERFSGYAKESAVLTRTINPKNLVSVELQIERSLDIGETLLLCTDGFWRHCDEATMLTFAQPGDYQVRIQGAFDTLKTQKLFDDNASVLAVHRIL